MGVYEFTALMITAESPGVLRQVTQLCWIFVFVAFKKDALHLKAANGSKVFCPDEQANASRSVIPDHRDRRLLLESGPRAVPPHPRD
ncbi:hypothetical protein CABS01_07892 [Colletotrichum abscissum]|uniref:Uncharacterized protein n=1 Tax=Colletotrichum abscissum TaxID=1671311 RepID=A0A9Q0B8Y9_9PEZI|nr:uncharacterized protein CABS01_07892 [Colletotrichum abscissum]KAI3557718.1 hypothetical protein CABS02_01900 [Colletotrichum abscissum]KAK1510220.1 hypothetical protein CABS01_07892 [Colletotrichum abscissum]